MMLDGMIAYIQEMVETVDNELDKLHLYQILMWLQELSDYRSEITDKDFLAIDRESKRMIEEEIAKRGKV